MEAASELDITLIASASLLQGQVAKICRALSGKRLGWRTTRNGRCNSRDHRRNYDRAGGDGSRGTR